MTFLVAGNSCTSPAHNKKADSVQSVPGNNPLRADSHSWAYTSDAAKTMGGTDYFAAVTSVDTLKFKDTVTTGAAAILTIRHLSGKNRLTLTITSGRFLNTNANGASVRMKFDSGPAARYACDPGLDGSKDMLYIHPANNLINRLKKSKRLIIEANFLNGGMQQLTFNVGGLKWNHKPVYLGD